MSKPTSQTRTTLSRAIAGRLAVTALELLARLPLRVSRLWGTVMLPFYLPFRGRTRATLRAHCPQLSPFRYYRTRLRLALLSLKQATGRPDGCRRRIADTRLFDDALATGRPVALLGWHQGPVELLHEIPSSRFNECIPGGGGRGFFLMTASAFSPALAEWMASGRRGPHENRTRIIRPGDAAALREWARRGGVLALMIDQVPGTPEDWSSPGSAALPWPRRLMEWILARDAVLLAVSALYEPDDRILFRYHEIPATRDHEVVKRRAEAIMQDALARAPEQYNWSYGKIRKRPGTEGGT